MNVTHVSSFGKLQFVHVSIDTFSGMIFASAHSGEKVKGVKKNHCLQAFACMEVPNQLKTDNGPAYTSGFFENFCMNFHNIHKTEIPYNPQGQAIVERANLTVKNYLEKTKKGEFTSPHARLSFVLYTLNFLLIDRDKLSAADRHRKGAKKSEGLVKWKELSSGVWRGSDPVLIRTRGSVSIFPKDAESPIWVPEHCVRSVIMNTGTDRNSLELCGKSTSPDASGDKKYCVASCVLY